MESPKVRKNRLAARQRRLMVSQLMLSTKHVTPSAQENAIQSVSEPISPIQETAESEPNDEHEYKRMKMKVESMEVEMKALKDELDKAKDVGRKLAAENIELKRKFKEADEFKKQVARVFTPGQMKRITDSHNRIIHWSVKDVSHAISLHAAGPRAYRWLQKNNYPLPGESTLRRWSNKIDISPGSLKLVFKLLETHTCMTKMEKVCILLADEMKIKASYEYDKNNDTLLAPANYVQVIMARGLFCDWKQPLFYAYDQNITKNILFETIEHLNSVDFDVVAVTTDLGGGNRGLWEALEITENNPFFSHPITSEKVFVLQNQNVSFRFKKD